MNKRQKYNRFKIVEHPKLRHNYIINIATEKVVGIYYTGGLEKSYLSITDRDKELTQSELIELAQIIESPERFYKYER